MTGSDPPSLDPFYESYSTYMGGYVGDNPSYLNDSYESYSAEQVGDNYETHASDISDNEESARRKRKCKKQPGSCYTCDSEPHGSPRTSILGASEPTGEGNTDYQFTQEPFVHIPSTTAPGDDLGDDNTPLESSQEESPELEYTGQTGLGDIARDAPTYLDPSPHIESEPPRIPDDASIRSSSPNPQNDDPFTSNTEYKLTGDYVRVDQMAGTEEEAPRSGVLGDGGEYGYAEIGLPSPQSEPDPRSSGDDVSGVGAWTFSYDVTNDLDRDES